MSACGGLGATACSTLSSVCVNAAVFTPLRPSIAGVALVAPSLGKTAGLACDVAQAARIRPTTGAAKIIGNSSLTRGPADRDELSAARHRRHNGAGGLCEPVSVAKFRPVPIAFTTTGFPFLELAAQHDRLAMGSRQAGRAPRTDNACKGRLAHHAFFGKDFFERA
jgi:hypothetical protein